MTEISVIIPIFNTENYLEECLDSVFNQSFEDFEVICVNDGSTDNSVEILERYVAKNDNMSIINNQNEGLSVSRNIGLDNSNGKYVMFLDSDDILMPDALKACYELCESKSLDLLLFKIINFDDETKIKSKYSYFEMDLLKSQVKDNVFSYSDVKDKLFRISVTAPGKLYRKDLINDIRFNQGMIFEDNPFFIELFLNANKVYFHDEYLYLRRVRNDSIVNSNFNKFSDVIRAYDIIEDIIKHHGEYEEVKHKLFNRQCRDIFLRFSQVPEEYKSDFFTKIKDYFLAKNEAYQNDGTLELASKRSREIFFRAMESDIYKEFELHIEIFDLNRRIKKLKKENKTLINEINDKSKSKKSIKKLFKH